MKILIDDHRKIHAIQQDFTKQFPYLKMEFLAKPHKVGGGSPKKMMEASAGTLGECRTIHDTGTITIVPQMTVADLEQNFKEVYGLSVQVFRKSGKAWLETTVTDGWTLDEQNRQGESLSATVQ